MKKSLIILLVAANQLAAMSNVGRSVWRAGKACLSTMQKVQLTRPVVASNSLCCGSSNVIYPVQRPISVVPSVASSKDSKSARINLAHLILFGASGAFLASSVVQTDEQTIDAVKAENGSELNELLTDAIQRGSLERVVFLVEQGADVNKEDLYYYTPLRKAIPYRNLDIIQYLIEKGADVNRQDRYGDTPLSDACRLGRLDIVKYLFEQGANVNIGTRSLFTAIDYGHLEIVKYLVERGADVNKEDRIGNTPLLEAILHRKFDIIKYLIQNGADVNKSVSYGKTPLIKAFDNGYLEIVEYLVEHGADVNQEDLYGRTLLFRASYDGQFDMVKYLVEHGADVNKKGCRYDATVLSIALMNNRLDIVEYLLDHGIKESNEIKPLLKLTLKKYDVLDPQVQKYLEQNRVVQECCASELIAKNLADRSSKYLFKIVQLEAEIHARGNYAFAHGCPKEHGLYRIFATELYNATHNKSGFQDGYVAPRFVQEQSEAYMQQRLETRNYNNSDYLFCQPTALHGCTHACDVSPFAYYVKSFAAARHDFTLAHIALLYGVDKDLVEKYENRFQEVEELYYSSFDENARHGLLVEYEVSAEFAKNYMRYRHLYSADEKLSGSSYEYIQKGEYNPETEHIIPTGFLMRSEIVNKHVTTHLVGIDRSSDEYKKFEQACKELIQDLLAENSLQAVHAMFERQGMHTDWN